MTYFSVNEAIFNTQSTQLRGLSDLQYVEVNGVSYLLAAAEADGALTSFRIEADGSLTQVDVVNYSSVSGTKSVSKLELVEIGGQVCVIPAGAFEDNAVMYDIASGGDLISMGQMGAAQTGSVDNSFRLEVDGGQYILSTKTNEDGFVVHRLNSNGSLTYVDTVGDTASVPLGDVSDFASIEVGGTTYLFVASALDAGVISYAVTQSGGLTQRDVVLPSDGSGFSNVEVLQTVEIDGTAYLLMGSAGTNSLVVYSVGPNGNLLEVDHILDTGDTRFQDISTLEVFSYNGHTFALVAGSDDGMTLLHIGSDGQVSVVTTLADDFRTSLENISDIEVVVGNGGIMVFASSGSEDGVTSFTLDLGGFDPTTDTATGAGMSDYSGVEMEAAVTVPDRPISTRELQLCGDLDGIIQRALENGQSQTANAAPLEHQAMVAIIPAGIGDLPPTYLDMPEDQFLF